MNELISLIETLLNAGTLKIDLTVRVSMEQNKIKLDPSFHTAQCPKCDWTQRYVTEESARRGLRSHAHHCPARAGDYEWIGEHHPGAK